MRVRLRTIASRDFFKQYCTEHDISRADLVAKLLGESGLIDTAENVAKVLADFEIKHRADNKAKYQERLNNYLKERDQ